MDTNKPAVTELLFADVWRSFALFLRHLLKKWYVLVLAGLLGGIAGIGYAWWQAPKFEARASFALEDNKGGLGAALGLASEFGITLGSSGGDAFAGENIVVILTSRRMIERVLLLPDSSNGRATTMAATWLRLKKRDFAKHPRLSGVRFEAGVPRSQFSYLQDSVLYSLYEEIVKSHLSAGKPDRKLNFYEVKFNSPDEQFSKRFLEKLIAETTAFYTDLRSKKSGETLRILESRVAAMKGSARSAIGGQASIRDANVNPAFASADAPVLEKQLDVTAYGRAYEELFKNLELARYQYLQDIPLLQMIDAPAYPMKNLKPGRLKSGIMAGFAAGVLAVLVLFARWQAFGKKRPE